MVNDYLELMRYFVAAYGLAAVFLLGVIEEIVVFIPSSIIFIAIGFLLIDPYASGFYAVVTSIFKIGLPGALGVTLGSFLLYRLVYWGGKPFVEKWGRYINLNWQKIEKLNKKFTSGHIDEFALLFLRIVPILPVSTVTIFCGLIRLNLREFLLTTFFGTFIRVTSLSLLGWYLGKEYEKYAWQIAAFEKYFLIALIIIFISSVIYFYIYGKQKKS